MSGEKFSRVMALALVAMVTGYEAIAVEPALPDGLELVPASDLQGDALAPAGERFTIASPGRGWVWVRYRDETVPRGRRQPRAYDALDRASGQACTITVSPDDTKLVVGEEYMRGIESGWRKGAERVGGHVDAFRFSRATIPFGPAFRFTVQKTSASGDIRYLHGYVAGSDPKYVIYVNTPSAQEPEFLVPWVTSLRIRSAHEK